MCEDGLDEFDGAAGTQDGDLHLDLVDGERAQDVVGEPADGKPVVAAGVAVEFDGVRHQPEGRCDVLFVRFPRAADVMRGPEGGRPGSFEIAHRQLLVRLLHAITRAALTRRCAFLAAPTATSAHRRISAAES